VAYEKFMKVGKMSRLKKRQTILGVSPRRETTKCDAQELMYKPKPNLHIYRNFLKKSRRSTKANPFEFMDNTVGKPTSCRKRKAIFHKKIFHKIEI
jgi:hypothetical protein